MQNKTCTKCNVEHPATLEYFRCEKRNKDGLHSHCRKCSRKAQQIYRQSEDGKKAHRKWENDNPNYSKQHYSTLNGYIQCIYNQMKRRCNNSNCKSYKNYGGRGIQNKFKSLDDFRNYIINELQVDPRGLQMDRTDNDGHYEKGNIRFVTQIENLRNKNRD